MYERGVTLFNKVVSAYGRKFHLSDRWREYERFMKRERSTKNADQISHELKGLTSRWLREEKKERESRRERRNQRLDLDLHLRQVPPEEITMLHYKMDNIREAKGTLPGD